MYFQFSHNFAPSQEVTFKHCPDPAYLALVDLQSYRRFVSPSLDYLGMLNHLGSEMASLRAVAWGCPENELTIKARFATEHPIRENEATYSAGFHAWLRSSGRIVFASHGSLYHCATDSDWQVEKDCSGPEVFQPREFIVPVGLYCVYVFRQFGWLEGAQDAPHLNEGVNYSVVLRHYRDVEPQITDSQKRQRPPWV